MFQKSILKNIKQNEKVIKERWEKFKEYLSKIDYIKKVKEEKFQTEFLQLIFENCLGYTLDTTNPNDYNLEREKTNETDSKKADGVILVDNKVIGIIELKAQNTKNLDKIENQAFNYLVSHSFAKYVIISNFDEVRFYINKKTEYEKFSLFNMNYEEFKKFHLLLSYESIKKNLPIKLKEKSQNFEKDISNALYKDFSEFRLNVFENLIKNNSSIDKKTLLRLTQKLCDRIIFILFAEDRGLLNPNTIKEIREEFKNQKFTNFTLYDIYKFYFEAINNGNEKLNIPKYNGGLFSKDELLDSLKIDDEVLDEKAQKLSDYDFLSDVDVNILGHIFEQSLTDIEELNASINEISFDKKKSKRKKDGVFYTPKYITEYIVNNTIGKLCEEKRKELNILEITPPKNSKRPTKKEQVTKDNLEIYKNWLFNLKILDPACGSGAFLNQALEFLINEHKKLQQDLTIMGDITAYYEIETSILENNLYGVDINEDAVEIAKLSLWIRTATRGRKLTSLATKIKVGNSLIDDKNIADNAFIWEKEFSEVFENGGFDVVIGNPPYVRIQGLKNAYENETKFYEKTYKSAIGNYDIYVLFMEKGFNLINKNGLVGFILPHKFLISDFGKGIREFLYQNKGIKNLIHFGSELVFEEASTYTCIITLSHNNQKLYFNYLKPTEIFKKFEWFSVNYEKLQDKWQLSNPKILQVLEKIDNQPLKVKDVFAKIFQGLATSGDNVYLLLDTKNGLYSKSLDKIVEVENGLLKPILKGDDVHRYAPLKNKYFVIFPYLIENNKAIPMTEEYIKINFPKGYEYLKANEEFLRGREKGKMDKEGWFLYIYPKSLSEFDQTKIITPDIALKSQMSLDEGKFYHGTTLYSFIKKSNIKEDYKYFLTLFNSSVMWFFIKNTGTELNNGYFRFKTKYLEPFGLPKIKNYNYFIENIKNLISISSQKLYDKNSYFEILEVEDKKLKITEFLFAKQRGYINNFKGHIDLDLKFYLLLPFLEKNLYIKLQNSDDKRISYGFNLDNKRTLLITTDDDIILSIFIQNNKNLNKQINNKRFVVVNQFGETATPLTLNCPAGSCPKTFWRQTDLLNGLYHTLNQNSNEYEKLTTLSENMLELNKQLQTTKESFFNELELEKIPKKLQNFEELEFDEFIKEIKKAKKLKFKDKLEERDFKKEWRNLFENDKLETNKIKENIKKIDNEIDEIVFELYGLNDEEIEIIKGI